jgi:hypothetical protein
MDDLLQFLRDRLDEDEQAARRASSSRKSGGEWQFVDMQVRAGDGAPVTAHTWVGEGTHIARHDPARVLREVDAKRQIVDQYDSIGNPPPGEIGPDLVRAELGRVLRLLALQYSDHPDYRQEWRP